MNDWRLQSLSPAAAGPAPAAQPAARPGKPQAGAFDAALQAAGVRVSSHAGQRLATRDINLGAPEAQRLADAVNRAEQKGGRDSLILMDDLAFIVDVQRRMVVTAIDSQNRKEGVFTNIDTVVLAS